jgi:hypothetical protein
MAHRPPRISASALFERAMQALGAYRQSVVLVGGFARDLYRLTPGFAGLGLHGAETNDVDFAITDPLGMVGDQRLHDLLSANGLIWKPRFGLRHRPTGGAYFPAENAAPRAVDPHLEFITPLHGPDREEAVSRPQQDDLHAAPLRYVGMLLDRTITVDHPKHGPLRIPHPLHYILQKNLIRDKRQQESKQAKDQADAFYVLLGLRTHWSEWRTRWEELATAQEPRAWQARVLRQWQTLYRLPRAVGAEEVVGQYPGLTVSGVCQVMEDLERIIHGSAS